MVRVKEKAKRGRPPKAKRKRQRQLPGMESPSIPAIDKAAEAFLEAKEERFTIIKSFADAKLNLVAAMREHKLAVYEFDGYMVKLDESQSVDVKKKKEPKPESTDGDDSDQ